MPRDKSWDLSTRRWCQVLPMLEFIKASPYTLCLNVPDNTFGAAEQNCKVDTRVRLLSFVEYSLPFTTHTHNLYSQQLLSEIVAMSLDYLRTILVRTLQHTIILRCLGFALLCESPRTKLLHQDTRL